MKTIQARTEHTLHPLMAERWSTRAFDLERRVPAEHLQSMLEAARWTPSCFNAQPWRFLVCDYHEQRAPWQQALHCLTEKNQSWACKAPVLILAFARERFSHNEQPNRWAHYDTGAAMMSLVLQATASGLMSHQMGGYDSAKVRSEFAVPDGYTPTAIAAIGYPGASDHLLDEHKAGESAPRVRQPLSALMDQHGHWSFTD